MIRTTQRWRFGGCGCFSPELEEHPNCPDGHDISEQRVRGGGSGGGGRGGSRRRPDGRRWGDCVSGRSHSRSGHEPDRTLRIGQIIAAALGVPTDPDDDGHPVWIHDSRSTRLGYYVRGRGSTRKNSTVHESLRSTAKVTPSTSFTILYCGCHGTGRRAGFRAVAGRCGSDDDVVCRFSRHRRRQGVQVPAFAPSTSREGGQWVRRQRRGGRATIDLPRRSPPTHTPRPRPAPICSAAALPHPPTYTKHTKFMFRM